MPEYLVQVVTRRGWTEHRLGQDARHVRRMVAGIRGYYGRVNVTVKVLALADLVDVTADFVEAPHAA